MTEVIEPSGPVSSQEFETLITTSLLLLKRNLKGISICGSLPPGVPESFYVTIAQNKPDGAVLLLDALNADCLMTAKVDIIKINLDEARKMMNDYESDYETIGLNIHRMFPVLIVAITSGAGGLIIF
jgi:fructose-1-phosphate kinase PfkB-like protein